MDAQWAKLRKKYNLVKLNRLPQRLKSTVFFISHSGPENLKSRGKKLVKSNKSISRKNFFDQIPFFAISKMEKNQFFNWEKV